MALQVDRQGLAIRVLEILNTRDGSVDIIQALQECLKEGLAVDAVGIRLRQEDDFPFRVQSGYSESFLASEDSLCSRDGGPQALGEDGKPVLECACGSVLRGDLHPDASFRTDGGSFWVNRSSSVAVETPPGHLPPRARFTCVHEGYETMAMVPLRSGDEIVGLLQLNDRRPDLLELDLMGYLEGLANSIGIGLDRERSNERLAASHAQVERMRDGHRATLDMLRTGVVRLARDGRIDFVNRVAERFTFAPRETLIGRHFSELPFVNDPLDRRVRAQLEGCEEIGEDRISIKLVGPGHAAFRLEAEVACDAESPDVTILFVDDVTEVRELRRLLDDQGTFHDLVGQSEPMTTLFRRIQEVASVDFTVLVEGETGTGKELVARAIHNASSRAKGPFIAVNCAGLSETLLTSQLFGHRRGAFTGAVADHQGYFEAAGGGTLFLDEIGDISPGLQATLLRVLEEKVVTRVGDTVERQVDVRIVAATHHDLAADAREGRFRSDLLYRLRVARLILPPLSSRREDVPLLVGHFLRRVRAVTGKEVLEVSPPAMRLLLHHGWPGNVRELKAAIEYASLHAAGARILEEDLPPEIRNIDHFHHDLVLPTVAAKMTTAYDNPEEEKAAILAALDATEGNRSKAAKRLGVSRATFYRRLTEYGLV